MKSPFTRRRFLGSATALGATAILPSSRSAVASATRSEQAAAATSDVATRNLVHASVAKVKWQAQPFDMPDVRLLPGPFKDMMELNRSYLYSLPNERLAHNFRVTAGIPSDADPLGDWEAPDCELRGHYVGH